MKSLKNINNELIDFEEIDNGLIGFKINEGKNQITMEYKTPGLNLGILISIISIISLITHLIISKRKIRG